MKENVISEIGDLDGIELLKAEDVQILLDAIEKANAERTKVLPETSRHGGRKKIEPLAPLHARRSKLKNSTIPTIRNSLHKC